MPGANDGSAAPGKGVKPDAFPARNIDVESSMPADNVAVTVVILDREYRIACPEEEKPALMEAASHLDRRMREIRDSGKVVGLDRVAVMAALNITHDYLECRREDRETGDRFAPRITALREQLDAALDEYS